MTTLGTKTVKHVLGLSGGKDSAALAVYMKNEMPEIPVEYFFTDTGSELPEVYSYLVKLEGFLGQEIIRLNSNRGFDYWMKKYNNFLPSPQQRWCTIKMKLWPFEEWIDPTIKAGGRVVSYVAIRADEDRSGYRSNIPGVEVEFPLKTANIDKLGVMKLLKDAGLDLPDYYRWRSRSGCTFCFFQQKIEWVRLKEEHPDKFEEAKSLEKNALHHGSPFTWSQGESLEQLSAPERIEKIKADYEKRLMRAKASARSQKRLNPFIGSDFSDCEIDEFFEIDELYGRSEIASSCVICHK